MALVTLEPFPIRDQLAKVPGRVVQNARMDCVFDTFAACVEKLTGLVVSGDEVLDFTKSPTYQGAGNAAWLVGDVAKHFGVQIARFPSGVDKKGQPLKASQARLMAAIRDYLLGGQPSLITIPSAWNSQPGVPGYNPASPTFSTHVVGAYAIEDTRDKDGALVGSAKVKLMNPWPESYFVDGHRQIVTVEWLTKRLCYGSIWPVQALPSEWHDVAAIPGYEDNGSQLRRKGGTFVYAKGFRKFSLLHPELFTGVFAGNEPEENEVSSPTLSTQRSKYVTYIWTPQGGVKLMENKLVA